MFRTRLARALLVPAMVIPISVGALAFAGVASAAKPAAKAQGATPVKCKVLTGTIEATGTLTGCTATDTGGSGTFPTVPASSATLSWVDGHSTTSSFNYAAGSGTDCPSGGSEFVITGTVTASTAANIVVGDKIKGDVCADLSTGALTLYPGTKFKI